MKTMREAIAAGFRACNEANAEDPTPYIEEKFRLWIAQELAEKYPRGNWAYQDGYEMAMKALGVEEESNES